MKKYAYALASKLVSGSDNNQPLDIITYGLEILINVIVQLSFLSIVGYLFGILPMVLSAVIPTIIFRYFSGGSHLSSFTSCTIVSTLIFCSIGFVASLIKLDSKLIVLIFLLIMFITYKYAPNSPNRNFNRKRIQTLKLFSLLYLTIVIIIILSFQINRNLINAVVLGVLWQSFVLTPIGLKIISIFDIILEHKGGEDD